ncbi:MAG: hypothetical protein Q8O05_07605 [Chloroflexota bacterium]|nr:hypothetical protein [Chloroflexota bacterium]
MKKEEARKTWQAMQRIRDSIFSVPGNVIQHRQSNCEAAYVKPPASVAHRLKTPEKGFDIRIFCAILD